MSKLVPPPPIRARVLTLAFSPALGAIDDAPLRAFVTAHTVVDIRAEFLHHHGVAQLACLIVYRATTGRGAVRPL